MQVTLELQASTNLSITCTMTACEKDSRVTRDKGHVLITEYSLKIYFCTVSSVKEKQLTNRYEENKIHSIVTLFQCFFRNFMCFSFFRSDSGSSGLILDDGLDLAL